MSSKKEAVALFLAGSFYPLHEGHLKILQTAKYHLEEIQGNALVTHCILCPSHWSAVLRKFQTKQGTIKSKGTKFKKSDSSMERSHESSIEELNDLRTSWARNLLPPTAFPGNGNWDRIENQSSCNLSSEDERSHSLESFIWCDRILQSRKNPGVRAISQSIRAELAEKRGIRMIQVVGADSRAVDACLLKKHQKDEKTIVVVDSRGIPSHHQHILNPDSGDNNNRSDDFMIFYANHPQIPWELPPPMSSTIQRFLHANAEINDYSSSFFPSSIPTEFQPSWLSDTGITLGAGRQGFVRLMRLGLTFVAVKVYVLNGGKYDTFENEKNLWWSLKSWSKQQQKHHIFATTATKEGSSESASAKVYNNDGCDGWTPFDIVPRLYGVCKSPDGKFGYIVTEIAIPLTEMLPNLQHKYNWDPKQGDDALAKEFLDLFPLYPVDPALWESHCETLKERISNSVMTHNRNNKSDDGDGDDTIWSFKAHVVKSLWNLAMKLKDAGIYHRDLKVSNILLVPRQLRCHSSFSSVPFDDLRSSSSQNENDDDYEINNKRQQGQKTPLLHNHDNREYCQVLCCDLGVAKFAHDTHLWISRGMTRQYPMIALQSKRYDVGCESYFLACTIYEIIDERQFLHEAEAAAAASGKPESSGTLAARMKRNGHVPHLSEAIKKKLFGLEESTTAAVRKGAAIRYIAHQWERWCQSVFDYYNPKHPNYNPNTLKDVGPLHLDEDWVREHSIKILLSCCDRDNSSDDNHR